MLTPNLPWFLFALLSGIGLLISSASPHSWVVFGTLVVLLGIPHGALDALEINRLFGAAKGSQWRYRCYTVAAYMLYAILIFAAAGLWLLLPDICLAVFFIIGAYHFRHDWYSIGDQLTRIILAYLTISAPALVHEQGLMQYFLWLYAEQGTAQLLIWAMQLLSLLGVCALVYRRRFLTAGEWLKLAILIVAALLLDPVIYFSCYFCGVHAYKHTEMVLQRLNISWQRGLKAMLWPQAITLVLLALLFFSLPVTDGIQQFTQTVFIGLFCLTLPHLLLTEYILPSRSV